MTITELLKESHKTAISKGWWDLPIKKGEVQDRNFGELLALCHSEISEALEEYRKGKKLDEIYYDKETGKPEGIAVEFADLFIRIADICEAYGIPLEEALEYKMEYNRGRPYRHGGKIA